MATSDFTPGASIAFDPLQDSLNFPGGNASQLRLVQAGPHVQVWLGAQQMTLQGVLLAQLTPSSFTFADGRFIVGTAGADNLAGDTLSGGGDPLATNDFFLLSHGGSDTAAGGGASDVFDLGAALDAGDVIDGGAGFDVLRLSGDYAGTVVFGAQTVTGIERIELLAGHQRIQLAMETTAGLGEPLAVDAQQQGAGDSASVDGSAVLGTLHMDGGDGNDTLTAGAGHDAIDGHDGNDVLAGGGGNDLLEGGQGGDALDGGAGNDTLRGEDGNDMLAAGGEDDRLEGGAGSDTLGGGAGNDTLYGGMDADVMTGGAGNDRFVFEFANPRSVSSPSTMDTITDFGDGDLLDFPALGLNIFNSKPLVFVAAETKFRTDAESPTSGNLGDRPGSSPGDGFIDVMWRLSDDQGFIEVWADGDDDGLFSEFDIFLRLYTTGGKQSLTLADFAENFIAWRGTAGADFFDASTPGIDIEGANTAYALGGNDALEAGGGNDFVSGGLGNDTIDGGEGDDQLHGGSGSDTVIGGSGNDLLVAAGVDTTQSNVADAAGAVNLLQGGTGDDSLVGSNGKDSLWGEDGRDHLQGGDNDDFLDGGADDDYAEGGRGNDTVLGQAGNDTLDGWEGDDSVEGGIGDDNLSGYHGRDTLRGGDGNDVVDGHAGSDFLEGGEGDDTIIGGFSGDPSQDTIDAGAGNDWIYLGDASVVTTGSGADTVALHSHTNSFANFASEGFFSPVSAPSLIKDFDIAAGDRFATGILDGKRSFDSAPLVWRGTAAAAFTATLGQSVSLAGTDAGDPRFLEVWVAYDGTRTSLYIDRDRDGKVSDDDFKLLFDGNLATNGDPAANLDASLFSEGTFVVKIGTSGADGNVSPGLGSGSDLAYGLGGNDTLDGAEGDDTLNGDAGGDSLSGGADRDSLFGGAGDDSLAGGGDRDVLYGGTGADTLDGGDGNDILYAAMRDSEVDNAWVDTDDSANELRGGAGNDQLHGSDGDDLLQGDADDDTLEGAAGNDRLEGGAGGDHLVGGLGNDTILGGDGNDVLHGMDGTDSLDGGAGDDTLWGGYEQGSADTLAGGEGNDTFFVTPGGSGVVMSLGAGADRVALWTPWSSSTYWFLDKDNLLSPASAPNRITDFDARVDTLSTQNFFVLPLDGVFGNVPLVWRGVANEGFTATVGQSLQLAGGDPDDHRFYDLWLALDGAGHTVLFVDTNRDGDVDGTDFKLLFDGNLATNVDAALNITQAVFSPGTFTLKQGTGGADTGTTPALGDGGDLAFALGGDDTLDGLGGNDTLNGDGGDDHLSGNTGHDMLHGGAGSDTLEGGEGADVLYGGTGSDTLVGGEGNDGLYAAGYQSKAEESLDDDVHNRLEGGNGDDYLEGSNGNDQLLGEAGLDYLNGGKGNDTLDGGEQADQLHGDEGNDVLLGGAGNDSMTAGAGNDSLEGGGGDDTLAVGFAGETRGVDTLDGGDGNDLFQLSLDGDAAVVTLGAGADRVQLYPGWADTRNFFPATNVDRITDFNVIEGDVLLTDVSNGLRGDGKPLVWRGKALDGFLANPGDSMTAAGADPDDHRFFDLYVMYDAGADTTILFADRNLNGLVDELDFRMLFDGDLVDNEDPAMNLSPAAFSAGTFTIKSGTNGNDVSTTPALGNGHDLAYLFGGDDTVDGAEGFDTLNGDEGNDQLAGGLDEDVLFGGSGNDMLGGGAGSDTLYGGIGSDTLEGGDDRDMLYAAYANSQAQNAFGLSESDANLLTGGAGDDTLEGSHGDDTLKGDADDDALSGGGGSDLLQGGDGNDALRGDTGDDSLDGGAGNDYLTGGSGADTILAGSGNDTVDAANETEGVEIVDLGLGDDRIGVAAGSGRVEVTLGAGADSYDLGLAFSFGNSVSQPVRITDFRPDEGDRFVTGLVMGGLENALPYVWRGVTPAAFTAQAGDAAPGADLGANVYQLWVSYDAGTTTLFMDRDRDFVVDAGDLKVVFDGNLATNDDPGRNITADSFSTGTFAVPAAGIGTGGSDTLSGAAGNDVLIGGAGADVLSGLAGNDMLWAGDGADQVDGGADQDTLWGEGGDDTLQGGDGNDSLAGGSGSDDLRGGAGADTLDAGGQSPGAVDTLGGGDGNDQLMGGYGTAGTVMDGGAGDDTTYGGDGADTIDGGAGDDSISAGGGNDRVFYDPLDGTVTGDSGIDVLVLREWHEVDLSIGSFDQVAGGGQAYGFEGIDFSLLEGPVQYAASSNDNVLIGTGGNDTLSGLDGNDTLDGGAGDDSLVGGAGDDTYVIDSLADVLVEDAGGGQDEIRTPFSYTLGGEFERITLIGNGTITGTANAKANILADLTGQGTLAGLGGNDLYRVSAVGTTLVEAAGGGHDKVESSVSWTLGAEIEDLDLVGAAAIDGTGNDAANLVRGNSGDNHLSGGGGDDTLVGVHMSEFEYGVMAGSDTMTGGAGKDTFLLDVFQAQSLRITDLERGEALEFTNWFFNPSDGSTISAGDGSTAEKYGLQVETVGGKTLLHIDRDYTAGAEMTVTLDGEFAPADIRVERGEAYGTAILRIDTPVSGTVTLTGTAAVGSTLTAVADLTDPEGLGTLQYRWFAQGPDDDFAQELFGYTGETFTPGIFEEGKKIWVEVSFTDGAGVNEAVTSEQTQAVLAPQGVTMGGMAYSWKTHVLLEGVEVSAFNLDGAGFAGASTGADGKFELEALPQGDYSFGASRHALDIPNGTINSADALAALRIAVGANPNTTDPDGSGPRTAYKVSPYQFIAADVNNDGRVNSADALAILRMAVKAPSAPSPAWEFFSESNPLWAGGADGAAIPTRSSTFFDGSVIARAEDGATLNFVAVLKGDVNGSYNPFGSVKVEASAPAHFIQLAAEVNAPVDVWGL